MDNEKLITIDIIYISNTDNVTNLRKYTLTKPHIKLVLFNQTNTLTSQFFTLTTLFK